jgi:hypothetical protein
MLPTTFRTSAPRTGREKERGALADGPHLAPSRTFQPVIRRAPITARTPTALTNKNAARATARADESGGAAAARLPAIQRGLSRAAPMIMGTTIVASKISDAAIPARSFGGRSCIARP